MHDGQFNESTSLFPAVWVKNKSIPYPCKLAVELTANIIIAGLVCIKEDCIVYTFKASNNVSISFIIKNYAEIFTSNKYKHGLMRL